jgi:hypothetical protein
VGKLATGVIDTGEKLAAAGVGGH